MEWVEFRSTLYELTASLRVLERTQLGSLAATEFLLLLTLAKDKSTTPQAELSKNEGMPLAPGLSALLARLEKRGLISRERDPNSRRNVLVSLTLLGQQELEASVKTIEKTLLPKLHTLEEAKYEVFTAYLKSFRSGLLNSEKTSSVA